MLLSASSSPRPLVSHYLMPFGLSICRHGCLLTGYLFHPTLQYFLRLCDCDNSSIFRLDAASCSPVICCNLSCIRWGLSVLAARVLRTIFFAWRHTHRTSMSSLQYADRPFTNVRFFIISGICMSSNLVFLFRMCMAACIFSATFMAVWLWSWFFSALSSEPEKSVMTQRMTS